MSSNVAISYVLGAAIAAGALLAALRKDRGLIDRLLLFVLPSAAALLMATLVTEFLESFFRIFTDGRLAPAASLLCGYRLYYPLEEGPILGLMYTPLAALMYVPAVLTPTPEWAVTVGEVLTMVYYFVPAIAVLTLEARRAGVSIGLAALIPVSFGFMTELLRPLSGPAFWIHADAPAIGFAAGACVWLHFRKPDSRFASFLGPSALATAAVLSKQVALPMLAVIPLYALIFEGRKAFANAFAAISVTALGAAAFVFSVCDPEGVIVNVILQPLRQPWEWSPWEAIWQGGRRLAEASLFPIAVIAGSAFFVRWNADPRIQEQSLRGRSEPQQPIGHLDPPFPASACEAGTGVACESGPGGERRWWIWIVVAMLMIPSCILGRVKHGGDENTLGYTVYFLAVAAHLRLLHICARRGGFRPRVPEEANLVALQLTVSMAVWLAPAIAARLPAALARFPENPERIGFEYAKEHPGEVYFPFHPLISLMSEGRAYHFSDGVRSRDLAKMFASEPHIRAYLPESLRVVAYMESNDYSARYLPGYSRRIQVEGLKGWQTFAQREPPKKRD